MWKEEKMKVKTLIKILETLPPNAKILVQNDSTYEDGFYALDRVDFYADNDYVFLDLNYNTEYSEVI
jgi:hypothetical protein